MKRRLILAGVLMLIAALVCSIVLAEKCRDKKVSLPAEVLKSLTESYPDASIKEVKKDEEELEVYEVELLLKDGQEVELTLTPDGKVMEVENEIEAAGLPFDVTTVVPKGGELKEVSSEVTYMVLMPVKLEQPKTIYNLEVMVDGQKMELEVAADGTVIGRENKDEGDDEKGQGKCKDKDKDKDKDNDEEDDD